MWQNEEMSIEEKLKAALNLKQQMENNFVSLGQLLSEMKRYKIYVSRGYKTFNEFVENEFNIASTFASKLISTYDLFIESLDKDEKTVKDIGLDKLNMIKPFVKQAKFIEAEAWINKAQEMPTAQLREEIKEIREQKAKIKRTMKDVLIDQYIEKMVTFFNCSRKELNFKLALFFQDSDLDQIKDTIRTRQRKFEDEQLKAQEAPKE
ncbi:MAG: hypothetical protein RAO94_04885 [Candidatus Stygibacter australis]|nr:hypothetical protein [Candidatus Stygibacter australis]MDP8321668.1 hypothetical protein [Candidatus Stygibacter australis]